MDYEKLLVFHIQAVKIKCSSSDETKSDASCQSTSTHGRLKKRIDARRESVVWERNWVCKFESRALLLVGCPKKVVLAENIPVELAEFNPFIAESIENIVEPGTL